MDAVFSRFDSFDFDSDQRFQDGLKTLNSADETKLLDVKLFFYNRFMQSFHQLSDGFTLINSVHTVFMNECVWRIINWPV